MNLGITGITGFIGARTAALAEERGHRVIGFSRSGPGTDGGGRELRAFAPPAAPDFSGLDAVLHLAGEPVVGRWTEDKKRRIRESRVHGTRAVVAGLHGGPGVLVSASGIGIYGDTGDRVTDEEGAIGDDFLGRVAREWEDEARAAEADGVRVARIRIGFVLGAGGALRGVAPIFRLGLGGRLGSGRQWMAPVHVDDVAALFVRAAEDAAFSGPFNACLPEPCTNGEFTRVLARTVQRPAWCAVPAFALRLALGELAALVLQSCRTVPRRTLAAGFEFRHPTLAGALRAAIENR
jgi:uncharacterized protein (TIGR01777 family)